MSSRAFRAVAAAACVAVVVASARAATGASTPPYRLRAVVTGLAQPTYVTAAPGDSSRLFVVERRGTVRVVRAGRLQPGRFLDIARVVGTSGERGLLSIAFHPAYPSESLVYAFYTDRDGNIRIVEFRVAGGRADPATGRVLVTIAHENSPYHNGGQLAFGPDGAVYVGVGDGGYAGLANAPDPNGNSQNTDVLLGKLFRLRVEGEPRSELVAYGLRNPWRFSFGPAGQLIIGDVGYKSWEEIDVVPAGNTELLNFGWSVHEGRSTRRTEVELNGAGRLVWPAHVYSTNVRGNCSVVGGYVYRGSVRHLRNRYVFGDFCSGRIWSGRFSGDRLADVRVEPVRVPQLASFGVDASGELYAVSLRGSVHRFVRR